MGGTRARLKHGLTEVEVECGAWIQEVGLFAEGGGRSRRMSVDIVLVRVRVNVHLDVLEPAMRIG